MLKAITERHAKALERYIHNTIRGLFKELLCNVATPELLLELENLFMD